MLVITAERLPHDPGTVLSEAPFCCESVSVFAAELAVAGHWKPDPVHCVKIVGIVGELELEFIKLKAHV